MKRTAINNERLYLETQATRECTIKIQTHLLLSFNVTKIFLLASVNHAF